MGMVKLRQNPMAGGDRQAEPKRRRAGALAFTCLLLAMVMAPLVLAGPALADPPTVDCGADPGNGQCGKLVPVLTCVWKDAGTGQISAVFGYANNSSHPIVADVGASNSFSPSPAGRGQTTSFPANTTVSNAFVVTWSGGAITWTLPGGSATAPGSSGLCSAAPAPALAETGVILGVLVVAVLISIAVFRERGGARPGKLIDRLLPR
jgi:hypothetical protein